MVQLLFSVSFFNFISVLFLMDYSHVCAKKWEGEVFTFGSCCSKFSFGNFVQYMLFSAF